VKSTWKGKKKKDETKDITKFVTELKKLVLQKKNATVIF